MQEDTISTETRPLIFLERMQLTWTLFWWPLAQPAVWLATLWSSGATVNISRTGQRVDRLIIERGKRRSYNQVTPKNPTVT